MLINLSEFGVVDNTYDILPKDLTFGNLSVHIEGTKVIIVLGEHIVKHIGILLKTAHISIADLDNLDTRTQVGHELNQTICQTPNKDAIRIIGDYAKEWGLYGFLDSRSEMKYAEVKNGVKS